MCSGLDRHEINASGMSLMRPHSENFVGVFFSLFLSCQNGCVRYHSAEGDVDSFGV